MAPVERSRAVEEGTAVGAHEVGRPGDRERLVRQRDDARGRGRSRRCAPSPPHRRRAGSSGCWCSAAMASRTRFDERRLGGLVACGDLGQRLAGHEVRPGLARQPHHLGTDGVVVRPGTAAQLLGREVAAQREAQLPGEELRAEAAVARGARRAPRRRVRRGRPRGAVACLRRGGLQRGHQVGGLAGLGARRASARPASTRLVTPASCASAVSSWRSPDRPIGQAREAGQRLVRASRAGRAGGPAGMRRARATARTRARAGRRGRCP